jgi:hypothetical protein
MCKLAATCCWRSFKELRGTHETGSQGKLLKAQKDKTLPGNTSILRQSRYLDWIHREIWINSNTLNLSSEIMNESEIKYWKIRHLVRVNNKSFFRDCLLLYTFIQHVHCTMKRLTSCIWSSSSTMPNRYKVDTWNIQHKHLYNMNRVPKSKSPLSTMEWSVERIRDL